VSRALFISDLHLSAGRPDTNQQFFRFLAGEAPRARALYILGDLFEYWIGDDALEQDALGLEVVRSLKRLADAGVQISLMHGNRDFLIGARFCAAAGAALLDDPRVVEIDGEPTLLMHGDTLCTDDVDYQAWRRNARSEAWQREFLARPSAARHAEIGALREKSKAVVQAKPADIMDVADAAVRAAFRAHGVARLIHGHTHRAARHALEVDGRRCERWVLPDWYGRGGYLALADGAPMLVSF